MTADPAAPFYVVGGTMTPDSPSYIDRRADRELYAATLAGEFCYVLAARQMGKSSLMARTVVRLREAGNQTAVVDLTQIGGAKSGMTAERWYHGIAHAMLRQLMPAVDARAWWSARGQLHALQRLTDLFRDIAQAATVRRIVVFVDEIDGTLDLPFSDEFFAAIRACYNARAVEPVLDRLTFVLLGVSTPQQLVQDQRQTPFNIGRGIELTDFTFDEALPLARGFDAEPFRAKDLLRRVHHWTDGQPYLTQSLCRTVGVAAQSADEPADAIVDQLVWRRYFTADALRDDHNLQFVSGRLTARPQQRQVLETYRQVVSGGKVVHDMTSPVHAALKLSGVVKSDGRLLKVRNRIYAKVFTADWVKRQLRSGNTRTGSVAVGQRVGRYEIIRTVGEGAASRVFLARAVDSGSEVVVKQLYAYRPGDVLTERLQREAAIMTDLRHPHIARVFDYIELADSSYLVGEYLPGGSLADRLANQITISEKQACLWCRDALQAIHYVHQIGVLHRDLKPANLMLDEHENIKVTDFGVARIFRGARLTRVGESVGTPAYMSPEQIVNPDQVYHSADVYSMGVVLYELLTGRLPFDAETEFALLEMIIRQPPTPIRVINSRLSERLEGIVLRTLEKDPARRYSSAAEFARQLDSVLASTGGTDSPPDDARLYHRVYDTMRRKLAGRLFRKNAE